MSTTNTNPTALSLAAILAAEERIKSIQRSALDSPERDEILAALYTITDAVEQLGSKNGNSSAVLWTLAETLSNRSEW